MIVRSNITNISFERAFCTQTNAERLLTFTCCSAPSRSGWEHIPPPSKRKRCAEKRPAAESSTFYFKTHKYSTPGNTRRNTPWRCYPKKTHIRKPSKRDTTMQNHERPWQKPTCPGVKLSPIQMPLRYPAVKSNRVPLKRRPL